MSRRFWVTGLTYVMSSIQFRKLGSASLESQETPSRNMDCWEIAQSILCYHNRRDWVTEKRTQIPFSEFWGLEVQGQGAMSGEGLCAASSHGRKQKGKRASEREGESKRELNSHVYQTHSVIMDPVPA